MSRARIMDSEILDRMPEWLQILRKAVRARNENEQRYEND